jgi:hypothetical protein
MDRRARPYLYGAFVGIGYPLAFSQDRRDLWIDEKGTKR